MSTVTITGSGYNSKITLAKIHAGRGYFKKDVSTTHSQVRLLQEALTSLGYDTLGVDGKYGNNTLSAVKDFQGVEGLTVDGLFGQASLAALEDVLGRHLDVDNCTNNDGDDSGSVDIAAITQAITDYSNAHRGDSDHISRATYFSNLDSWAAKRTIKYVDSGARGTPPNYTHMCCAYYPYISRNRLGGSGSTTEYKNYAATAELKGEIDSLGGYDKLIPGMEIFQGTETKKSHMGVYYGKYDFGEGLKHAVYQSTIPRTSLKAKYEDSNKEGPNLTAMNDHWKYWIWPKHIVL